MIYMTRQQLALLRRGSKITNTFGNRAVVDKVYARGVTKDGLSYACVYATSESGLTMSQTLIEESETKMVSKPSCIKISRVLDGNGVPMYLDDRTKRLESKPNPFDPENTPRTITGIHEKSNSVQLDHHSTWLPAHKLLLVD